MAHEYNAAVAAAAVYMPPRVRALPISDTGFPVPWFVTWLDGKPDFRVASLDKLDAAVRQRRCWVCGEPLGQIVACVVGPMCTITRTIAEPPTHRDCALFSARVCPFLANPRMRRREGGLPEGHIPAPGVPIMRNPGAVAVWTTRKVTPFAVQGGRLFELGEPLAVEWFAQGTRATREQVEASIASGFPLLQAEAEREGDEAVAALFAQREAAIELLPDE